MICAKREHINQAEEEARAVKRATNSTLIECIEDSNEMKTWNDRFTDPACGIVF
jgi:hypothetical protein